MGPSPAKVAFGVTHIGLWQPPCIDQTCYFRAKKETRKVPMFGDAYRCVCLPIFEIWCYTMCGSWFRSVSTWGVQEGLIWSVSNSILLLLSCYSFDRRERLGQTSFRSRWSVSAAQYQIHFIFKLMYKTIKWPWCNILVTGKLEPKVTGRRCIPVTVILTSPSLVIWIPAIGKSIDPSLVIPVTGE
jgi:hypothetical protein